MTPFLRFLNTRLRGRVLATAAAAAFAAALPSCGIPNLRHAEPAPPLPGQFDVRKPDPKSDLPDPYEEDPAGPNGAASSAQLNISEFFSDPQLLGLIQQALMGNQEQRILIQDVQIAYNRILARQGAYMPFVTVGGNAGIDKNSRYTIDGAVLDYVPYAPGKYFTDPHGVFDVGANLWWQIDIWRQLRDARDAAVRRYLATNEGRNFAVTRLVAEIADNYYLLLALDQRLQILDQIIGIQEQSIRIAERLKEAARGTELAVQRFTAEVRKNQSEKLIVRQRIVEAENRINFLVGRFPQPVERAAPADFVNLSLPRLSLGLPPQLLQNRPDIRQAELELAAAGLDVNVARKMFYPRLIINGGVGWRAFNPQYLLITPEALVYNLVGELVAPVVNRRAIQAEYLSASSQQLQAVYNYQRVIINAFTEVINRMSKVENYGRSIDLKKQQLAALELSVDLATQLFQRARTDYVDVLFAQRDLLDARTVLIETKQEQLSAIVNTYQALGGGNVVPNFIPQVVDKHLWLKQIFHHGKGRGSGLGPQVAPGPPPQVVGPIPPVPVAPPAAAAPPPPVAPPPPPSGAAPGPFQATPAANPDPGSPPQPASPPSTPTPAPSPLPAPAATPDPLPGAGPGTGRGPDQMPATAAGGVPSLLPPPLRGGAGTGSGSSTDPPPR